MTNIDELSRIIGNLESSIQTLFHKQDALCKEIKALNTTIQGRRFKDSFKIYAGGIIGGFTAVAAKFLIWRN